MTNILEKLQETAELPFSTRLNGDQMGRIALCAMLVMFCFGAHATPLSRDDINFLSESWEEGCKHSLDKGEFTKNSAYLDKKMYCMCVMDSSAKFFMRTVTQETYDQARVNVSSFKALMNKIQPYISEEIKRCSPMLQKMIEE
jgi:hypothetical protein